MKFPSHFYAMVDPAGGHEPAALARILFEAGARVMQLRLNPSRVSTQPVFKKKSKEEELK